MGMPKGASSSSSVPGIVTGKWAKKRRGRKIFGHGFMEWDPLVKWLLLTLAVATILGYVLVVLIVLKVQEKGPWAQSADASPFYNRVITDHPGQGLLADQGALVELLRSDARGGAS